MLRRNRSYRRFCESEKVPEAKIRAWIHNLRYTSSMRNAQPLKYRVVVRQEEVEAIYPLLKWAGYLPDWEGPKEGERPASFVVQLLDTTLSETARFDEGLHLSAFTLQAAEEGFACCIIAAFNAERIKELLHLGDRYKPLSIVAIGIPKEIVVVEELIGNDIKYYRTADSTHHVPKRRGEELLVD